MQPTIPFYVIHYTRMPARRKYIETAAAASRAKQFFDFHYVEEFDREDLAVESLYQFDESAYRRIVGPIKNILIGYVIGLFHLKTLPFHECVSAQARRKTTLDEDFAKWRWLRPHALKPNEVSCLRKHRAAWEQIAQSSSEWCVLAEDDIIFRQNSLEYLIHLIEKAPQDAEYIDIAGGCGLVPRIGNAVVNGQFYRIDPPRDRTTCCSLLRRSFAQRLLDLDLPYCVPTDWTLTHAFTALDTKVYWVEPVVFGHGSEMKVYESTTKP